MTDFSRRGVIASAGAVAAMAPSLARATTRRSEGAFLWGAATAAHQIEGNNVGSDYWVLENIPHTEFADRSGDACDSWTRWREDIALVAGLGLNAYRFSVEWARIEPEPGHFSLAVLDHYRRMCAACREVGVTPVVTFHHFTSPRWIAARGGWEDPATADALARYCEKTARALAGVLDWACTINEPNAQVTSYVMAGGTSSPKEATARAEAARAVGSDRFGAFFQGDAFKVRETCLTGHAKAVTAIKSAIPEAKVGMTLALQAMTAGPGGEDLYRKVFDEARAPFYAAADGDDFVGVQPYERLVVGEHGYLPPPAGAELGRGGGDASPRVIDDVVREVRSHCRAPILITENGIDAVDDAQRERHLRGAIAAVEACRSAGTPLLGYIYWTLLDNFEWYSGYGPCMGLYAVNRETFARTPKPVVAVYRDLVARAPHGAA